MHNNYFCQKWGRKDLGMNQTMIDLFLKFWKRISVLSLALLRATIINHLLWKPLSSKLGIWLRSIRVACGNGGRVVVAYALSKYWAFSKPVIHFRGFEGLCYYWELCRIILNTQSIQNWLECWPQNLKTVLHPISKVWKLHLKPDSNRIKSLQPYNICIQSWWFNYMYLSFLILNPG